MPKAQFCIPEQYHAPEQRQAESQLASLSDEIMQFNAGFPADSTPLQAENAVFDLLNRVGIWDTLADNADDTAGMRQVVQAMNGLEIATTSDTSWFMQVVQSVKTNKQELVQTLGELFEQDNPDLHATLERAVDVVPSSYTAEQSLIRLVSDIVSPAHGTMTRWYDYDPVRPTLPPFMERIAERPYFARLCFEEELSIIERCEGDPYHRLHRARDAEIRLLEDNLGLSPQQSREYRLAIEARTILKQEDPYFDDGERGLNIEEWETAMRWYMNHVQHFGLERVKQLRDDWGIVNLDRYSQAQLERMCRLSDRDPKLLRKLRKGNVTLVSSDAFGDSVNAMAGDINTLETEDDLTLFSEIISPHSMYRPLVKLGAQFGVNPSTWAISTHGNVGYMGFGAGPWRRRFDIVPDARVWKHDKRAMGIAESQAAVLLRKYMRPHSVTGERAVVLLCCMQASRDTERTSTAERLAYETDYRDRVVVTAWDRELVWGPEGEPWDSVRDVPAPAVTYRKVSAVAVRASIGYDVPGLRLAA